MRKSKPASEVELDGLASDTLSVLPDWLKDNAVANFFKRVATKINPCHADEESYAWRIMCYLFPDCWCCAGLRGIFYGVLISWIGVMLYGH